jgi:GNAT superfamily N-acetyltransferase
MKTLDCQLPDITVTRPQGLAQRLFFKVYSGPNAIAFAQLSAHRSRQSARRRVGIDDAFGNAAADVFADEEKAPGISYYIRNIAVSQNYRNHGIGSALLDEVIRFCQDQQVISLYGQARGETENLRRWYQHKGFKLDAVDNMQLSIPKAAPAI